MSVTTDLINKMLEAVKEDQFFTESFEQTPPSLATGFRYIRRLTPADFKDLAHVLGVDKSILERAIRSGNQGEIVSAELKDVLKDVEVDKMALQNLGKKLNIKLKFLVNWLVVDIMRHLVLFRLKQGFEEEISKAQQSISRRGTIALQLGAVQKKMEAAILKNFLEHFANVFHINVSELLNRNFILLDVRYTHNQSPLHWAANYGDVNLVESLIKAGSNPNLEDDMSNTPLFHAVWRGNGEVVKALLARGADVNAVNGPVRSTALHAAIEDKHKNAAEIVRSLLEGGRTFILEILMVIPPLCLHVTDPMRLRT